MLFSESLVRGKDGRDTKKASVGLQFQSSLRLERIIKQVEKKTEWSEEEEGEKKRIEFTLVMKKRRIIST